MTSRPKVWEPRAESVAEEMPEWTVSWWTGGTFVRAPRAWDAWLQVKSAPAFGSCRVRRVSE